MMTMNSYFGGSVCGTWLMIKPLPCSFAPPPRRRRPLQEFWQDQFKCERRLVINLCKLKTRRVKRLQNHGFWKDARLKGLRKEERDRRGERKRSWRNLRTYRARRMGYRPTCATPTPCPVWSCGRPLRTGRKRRLCGGTGNGSDSENELARPPRCASQLSLLSIRSRSPITMRSSPLLNDRGFPIIMDK